MASVVGVTCAWQRLALDLVGDGPINSEEQAILLALYTDDVCLLREQLLADGIQVTEVQHPSQMPAGEIVLNDPDGYSLLVGRTAHDPADRTFRQSASPTNGLVTRLPIDERTAAINRYESARP
jgi:hypothetical protein